MFVTAAQAFQVRSVALHVEIALASSSRGQQSLSSFVGLGSHGMEEILDLRYVLDWTFWGTFQGGVWNALKHVSANVTRGHGGEFMQMPTDWTPNA